MKLNMGALDRIIRLVVGIAILVLGYTTQSWWGLVGLIPLGTAAIGWCPAYLPFGMSTCCKSKDPKT
ncbi:MAG: DUF2892 domain-containing protein [Verrucomicrobia bacterium]|nr:MAG: DUF2892 domain-containing protein [Verrucomicrobiota bacterium]